MKKFISLFICCGLNLCLFFMPFNSNVEAISNNQNLRIGIVCVSVADHDRLRFAHLTRNHWQKYAAKHGYDFYCYTSVLDPQRHPAWNKIPALLKHLDEKSYDWLACVDDDMLVSNPSISLESFIYQYGTNFNLIIQRDHAKGGLFNSGIFLLRVCPWSKDFLATAYDIGKKLNNFWQSNWEQDAFIYMANNMPSVREKIRILQHKSLQGFDNSKKRWKKRQFKDNRDLAWAPGDFIAHLSGQDTNRRVERITQIIKDLNL